MPENNEGKKTCGHPPNPPEDVDLKGRPYESCYQCFIEAYEKREKAMEEFYKKCKENSLSPK